MTDPVQYVYRVTRSRRGWQRRWHKGPKMIICDRRRAAAIAKSIREWNESADEIRARGDAVCPERETFTVERAPIGEWADVTGMFGG